MSHSEAVLLYGEDSLLTRKQGLVISARWTDINNALKAFGGSAIINAWTSEQNTNGNYYYVDQAGGILNSGGSSNKYVRRVVGTF